MPSILNATTTNGLVTSADNSGSLQLQTNNGTTAVTIDTSQNVGIGTTSPTNVVGYKSLEVQGSNGGLVYVSNSGSTISGYYGVTPDGVFLFSQTNSALRLGTNNTERMRIDSAGRVLMPFQPSFLVTQGNTSYQNQTITYGTVISNVGSNYNTGTGRFTAPVAGNYFFFAQTYPNGGQTDLSLRVNNPSTVTTHGRGQNAATVHISAIFTLAANDFVYVVTSGSPAYSDGSNWGYFGGHLIG